jgi:hypothetical protein
MAASTQSAVMDRSATQVGASRQQRRSQKTPNRETRADEQHCGPPDQRGSLKSVEGLETSTDLPQHGNQHFRASSR